MEHLLHTGIDTRQHHLNALALRHQTEVGEVVDTRGIDKGHLSHADDAHLGALMAQTAHDLLELITGTEEVRAIDLIDLYALGDGEMLEVAHQEVALLLIGVDLIADHAHIGGLCHTTHKEQAGTDQAYLDGYGEVENHREQEGDPQHNDIALGILHDAQERACDRHC